MLRVAEAEAPVEQAEPNISVLESVSYLPVDDKSYARSLVYERFGNEEWKSFYTLIQRESGWDSSARNPSSTAYGYGQFLDSTWKLVGCSKTEDEDMQIECTLKYIEKVYGTPSNALRHQIANNSY